MRELLLPRCRRRSAWTHERAARRDRGHERARPVPGGQACAHGPHAQRATGTRSSLRKRGSPTVTRPTISASTGMRHTSAAIPYLPRARPRRTTNQRSTPPKSQSLVPSSMGLTFCVPEDQEAVEVAVSWGRYVRSKSEESGEGCWKEIPAGGKITPALSEGSLAPCTTTWSPRFVSKEA